MVRVTVRARPRRRGEIEGDLQRSHRSSEPSRGFVGGRSPAATYVPLFEALNWAHALDERVAAHWVPNGKTVGFGWRDRIPKAEIMAGVRFARNSLHHDWSEAVVLRDGAVSFPLSFRSHLHRG